MASSIATAYVDLKLDTTGLQRGLNQVRGQLAGSTAAMGGMASGTSALGVGLAAAAGGTASLSKSFGSLSGPIRDVSEKFSVMEKLESRLKFQMLTKGMDEAST